MTALTFLQDEREFSEFCKLLTAENVRSYLEIGSKFGESLRRAATALPAGSRIVAVDLPGGTKAWRESQAALKQTQTWLQAIGYETHVVWGNSQDPQVVQCVAALGPYDCVFLDADHRLPGVTKDWENYGPMGRLVALHDIGWWRPADWPGNPRIDVPEFWTSLKDKYRHVEYKFHHTGQDNGIGVLWRNEPTGAGPRG